MIAKDYLSLYLELGLSPIPLRGKLPLTRWRDYEYNALDFTKGVNIGIKSGVLPGGDYLWFCDIDDKALIGEFYERHPNLMCAPLVSTARGFHLWMSWKEPVKTRVFDKMEIRGEGAYCVAPPSMHPTGHVYKFLIPLRGTPPTYNPLWLSVENLHPAPIVQDTGRVRPARVPWSGQFTGVPAGSRHSTLISYLGAMHKACFTEEDAMERALVWNHSCVPPLDDKEVRYAVHSAYERWDLYEL